MSYEEVRFEEKAVQLIPEDFENLSKYSWDVTGYPSRNGGCLSGHREKQPH